MAKYDGQQEKEHPLNIKNEELTKYNWFFRNKIETYKKSGIGRFKRKEYDEPLEEPTP